MINILINSEVEDYNKWKAAFDQGADQRKAASIHGSQVFQEVDNPNKVTILLEADSLEKALKLLTSDELKKLNKEVGVIGEPAVKFLKEDA